MRASDFGDDEVSDFRTTTAATLNLAPGDIRDIVPSSEGVDQSVDVAFTIQKVVKRSSRGVGSEGARSSAVPGMDSASLFRSIVTSLTEVVQSGTLGQKIASFGVFAAKSIVLNAAAFVVPVAPRITKRVSAVGSGGVNQVSVWLVAVVGLRICRSSRCRLGIVLKGTIPIFVEF